MLMEDTWNVTAPPENPLEPFLDKPIHVLISSNVLRDQVKLSLHALGFTNVTVHPPATGFSQSVQQLGSQLLKVRDAIFLVGAPLGSPGQDNQGGVGYELPDFFTAVRILLDKAHRDVMQTLSACVPVMEDIQFVHKRERIIHSLVEFGVSGAFILNKQDSLQGVSPKRKKVLYQEQLKERYAELKEYLNDFLPHMDESLEMVKEKWEERKLSERKAEAEELMRKAEDYKRTGNYDEAIALLKQAIEIFPVDPRAYMESGRVYVRMKKYPHAIKRFRQAEEVAEKLPEPNKEIGNVRVLQAKELLRAGEKSDSPKVMALLNDAVENFGKAMLKAEEVRRSDTGEDKEKNVNAVLKIAGDILKLEMDEVLGPDHPAVERFKSMARDSMLLLNPNQLESMSGSQLIFLGQTALDQGNFQTAEKHFTRAMEQEGFFKAACNEMIYMGHLVRRRKGPTAAIGIYSRLLEHNPPNISAVFFNMAVALAESGDYPGAVTTLCRGLFVDDELAKNPMFYHNPKLYDAIEHLAWFYKCLKNSIKDAENDPGLLSRGELLESLLIVLADNQAKQGLPLLVRAIKTKGFFQWEFALCDPALQQFVAAMQAYARRSQNPRLLQLLPYLLKITAAAGKVSPAEGFLPLKKELFQLLNNLRGMADRQMSAAQFAKMAVLYAPFFQGPDIFSLPTVRAFALELSAPLKSIDVSRLRR